MGKEKAAQIRWLAATEAQDYPAAESYLGLLYAEDRAAQIVAALRTAKLVRFKAKDIFRGSQLSLLGVSNSHVDKDRTKIEQGVALSPLLLVRDELHGKVIIADGYHRLCAVYGFNEDAWIDCKIV